ncbi:MAG: LysE family transporter [Bacteroidales bacterium]|nr:LysE family transporter [Bacteroidales bacterium]
MEIISPIINGSLVGITLALMFGPAFIVLLTTSLQRGFKAGVSFAVGVFISDALILTLAWFGLSQFLGADPRENIYFSIIGGIVLILFGAFTFFKSSFERKENPENEESQILLDASEYEQRSSSKLWQHFFNDAPSRSYVYVLKGLFLNVMNPGVWFVWITAMVTFGSTYAGKAGPVALFFGSTLITAFMFDILKAFIAGRLKNILKNKFIHRLNQIIGIILIAFGVYLIINNFYDLNQLIDQINL